MVCGIEPSPPPPVENPTSPNAHKYPEHPNSPRESWLLYNTHISLGHPEGANTEQIRNFSGFSHVLVQCTKISFRRGGMCMLFEICEKRPFQKFMGLGGGAYVVTILSTEL